MPNYLARFIYPIILDIHMLGIGEGKAELVLNKYNFNSGETIEGTVTLELKKPIKAKELTVAFYGERKETKTRMVRDSNGAMRSQTTTNYVRIHEFKQSLSGNKEYPAGKSEYKFKIGIPAGLMPKQEEAKGFFGKVANFISNAAKSEIKWYVEADLDMPWAFDISKKVQIQLM